VSFYVSHDHQGLLLPVLQMLERPKISNFTVMDEGHCEKEL